MFKRNVSPNLKGRIRQHYHSEQNNGIYEGDVLHYMKDGVGMYQSDEGCVYFGNFYQDTFHGEGVLVYKSGGILYANFQKGQLQGFFFASLCSQVSCGYMQQGKLQGPVFYYSPSQKLWQFYEYNLGKKVRKIGEELVENERQLPSFLVRDQILHARYFNFLDLRIESIFNKNVEGNLSLIESEQDQKQRFVGFINKEGKLNGLGCILLGDNLQSGGYSQGKINGLGRIQHANGDYYDGFFSKDNMEGQGFYYTQKTNSYILAQFKRNEYGKIIHSDLGQPTALCMKMRKEFHQKSLSYMNGQLSFKQILICLPELFKSFSEQLDVTSNQHIKAETRIPSTHDTEAEEEFQNRSSMMSPSKKINKKYSSKPFSVFSQKPSSTSDIPISQNLQTPNKTLTSQTQFSQMSPSNLSNRVFSQNSANSLKSAPFQNYPRAQSSMNKSSSSFLAQSFNKKENDNSLYLPQNQLDVYSPERSYFNNLSRSSNSHLINSINQSSSSQTQRRNETPLTRSVSPKVDSQRPKIQRYKPIFQEERVLKLTNQKNQSEQTLEKQEPSSNFSLATFSPLKFNNMEIQASLSEKSKIQQSKDQSSQQQKSVSPFRITLQNKSSTKQLEKQSSRPFVTLGDIIKRQTPNQKQMMMNENISQQQVEMNQTFTDITRSAQILQAGRSDYQGFGLTSQRINSRIDYPLELSQSQMQGTGKESPNKRMGISQISNKNIKQIK